MTRPHASRPIQRVIPSPIDRARWLYPRAAQSRRQALQTALNQLILCRKALRPLYSGDNLGPRAPAGAIERTGVAAALPRIGGPLRALSGRGHDLGARLTRAPLLVASRCAGEKGAKPRARGARPIARAPTLAPGSPRATPAAQALERRARADHAVARRPTAARTVRRDPPRALALLEHASRARGAIRPRPRRALAARPHTLHARGPRALEVRPRAARVAGRRLPRRRPGESARGVERAGSGAPR